MNFDGNFSVIGHIDTGELNFLVSRLTPQHWVSDTTRQRRYDVHAHTQSIGLLYDQDFRHIQPTTQPPMRMFGDAIKPVLDRLASHYSQTAAGLKLQPQHGPGYCIRASLVRLNPNNKIDPHEDKNFSLCHSHRVHIPIITNEQVRFHVGDQSMAIPVGQIVEINNRREHWVENSSSRGRVHLIIDWVIAGEPCCCAKLTHPKIPCSKEVCKDTDRMQIECLCFPLNART